MDKGKMPQKSQLIQGMNDICTHFDLGRDQFFMFVAMGMPIRKINSRWYGHVENIDGWFRKVTIGPPVDIKNGQIPADLTGDDDQTP